MWYEGNYRRIFLDMHIADWNEEFLSKLDPEKIVNLLKNAGAQQIVVKGRPHTGLAYFPTKYGRMHRGLKGRDYVNEMITLCHKNGIAAEAYFSQIFDNWAYENHPDWRMINGEGKTSREVEDYSNPSMFRKGRYGILCPNNEEYRQYVRNCLVEMTENYDFDAIFLDMPFFPEVCYCPSCKKRYFEETGREIPRVVDWSSPDFLKWQELREQWLGEFANFSSKCVKAVRPEVTIEHNQSCILGWAWQSATTDFVAEASDYVGGDMYGGFLQQSYTCKYYHNLSKVLPFVFISSRSDPNLSYHTTTKTEDEFLLHTMIALVHNGAFSICDGMNPDGTITDEAYLGCIKNVFECSRKYEKYISGDMITNVSVWFPSHSKCSWDENGKSVYDAQTNEKFLEHHMNIAKILREENIPFDVIPSKKLKRLDTDTLMISDVVHITDEEMSAIEKYVTDGGNLYISGHIGSPRMLELMEAESLGRTEHNVTYMNPTEIGKEIFEGFNAKSPMNVQQEMELMKFSGEYSVLATITLPYTMTGMREFSSIHSNPPGIHTEYPAAVMKQVGKGKVLWVSAPIEDSKPYMSRRVVGKMVRKLTPKLKFWSNAPSFVEVLGWEKDGKTYFAVINEQETSPIAPMYDIEILLPYKIERAELVEQGEKLKVEHRDGCSVIHLPKLEIFHIFFAE